MAAARLRRQPGQPLAAGCGVRSPYSASGVVLRNMAFEDEAHSAVAGDTLSLAQARVLVARVPMIDTDIGWGKTEWDLR